MIWTVPKDAWWIRFFPIFIPFSLSHLKDCIGSTWQTSCFCQSMHAIRHQCCECRWVLQALKKRQQVSKILSDSFHMADVHHSRISMPGRSHLHDRVLQDAGSCWCSVPIAFSQGRQVPWVLFQTQWIPGQAWLQDAMLVKAEQLGEVYMRTSLSSRLLKPPNTYITLWDKRGKMMLEGYWGRWWEKGTD